MSYTTHEAANAFPMMDGKSLGELTEDIRKNGLKVPVALYEGKVLDGRNRMLACNDAGVRPDFQDITSSVDDPYMWVWSLNGERRHLGSQEQKALIWRKLHGMSEEMQKERARIKREADKARSEAAKGRERNADGTLAASGSTDCTTTGSKRNKTREAEAKAAGVNKGALARADALLNESPEYAAKVAEGEMTFAEARREIKKAQHAKKVEEAAAKRSHADGLESDRLPELVMADPPWSYDHQKAGNREIENHYTTAQTGEIESHAPQTADDCILLLWATAPKLLEALSVVDAWGFSYKTCAVWDKKKVGMGYWFRGQHELLLVGVKGSASPTPEPARRSSVFEEPRGRHSVKPICVYEWVENAWPDLVKLEMYCRSPRSGWMVWGNEV